MARLNQATIDLSALRHNVGVVRALSPYARLVAVVKANAYGHGAIVISEALQPEIDALAVACIEEAIELRKAGITAPILLLEGIFEQSELQLATQLDLWITIANQQQLRWLEAATLAKPIQCWLKVDTGMNRLGVMLQEAPGLHRRLLNCNNALDNVVTYTHFAAADELQSTQTQEQIAAFDALSFPLSRSAANSAAVIAWPQTHYDWVRPGYMLYGNSPIKPSHQQAPKLKPVMTLCARVIALRDVAVGNAVGYGGTWVAQRPSRIATVSIGYGDGYPRQAANGTPVLINGQRAALAGRVSMDMITVDITDVDQVELGDKVILWGTGLPVTEVARCAQTVGYELTTRMPGRTPRVAVHGAL